MEIHLSGQAKFLRLLLMLEELPMSKKIKVRCNGQEHHVNEIDLERLREPTYVVRGGKRATHLPNPHDVEYPLYENCRYCAGHVIITREMVEEVDKR
jgi:hypothetical protein